MPELYYLGALVVLALSAVFFAARAEKARVLRERKRP